jgi:peptidoglycan/LPS O-acetylase OafA/YrhL
MAVSVAAAVLSYHLYETRFLRLKRFFDYAPAPNPAATPVPPAEQTVLS